MERDFMGLSSKEPMVVVKEELNTDGFKDIGFNRGSGMQWPFSSKVSAVPHFTSFKFAQEDKNKKFVSDPLMPAGFISLSTPDAQDPGQVRSTAEIKKPISQNRQGGIQFSLTAYPLQHDVQSVHRPHEVKMFPVSNHAISTSMTNTFKNHCVASSQNMPSAITKPNLLGGIPVTAPHSVLPTIASANNVKTSASPAQLTVFYAGAVHVFDDISPEKAQAIMFLAGNGSSSVFSTVAQPNIQVQEHNSKPAAADISPKTTPPTSCLSSPLSVSSHTGAQSGSGSTGTDEGMAAKTSVVSTTPISKPEPLKVASPIGSVAATTMIPSVPQARKASLARFLEKRKERVMSTAPYNASKKPLEIATPEINGMSSSATSAARIGPL